MKWSGGPIVAKSVVQGFRQLSESSVEQLRETTSLDRKRCDHHATGCFYALRATASGQYVERTARHLRQLFDYAVLMTGETGHRLQADTVT